MYTESQAQTYLKANAATALIGILNVGSEMSLSEHWTLQMDATISPWKNYMGKGPLVVCAFIPEGRYFFGQTFRGLYVGAHVGFGVFRIRRWDHPIFEHQMGWNVLLGGSIGYQWQWRERWLLDLFIGGGWQHAYYQGINMNSGHEYVPLNKSAEWLPYRGGLMFGYRF